MFVTSKPNPGERLGAGRGGRPARMALLLCGLLWLLGSSCSSQESSPKLQGFSGYLKDIGYSFYNPPRSDRGPGSVFRFVRLESGKWGISPVCRNLFPQLSHTVSDLSIPNSRRKQTFDLDFVLGLLGGLIEEPAAGELGSVREIEVTFGGSVQSHAYFEEDGLNDDGSPRELSPACYARLKALSAAGGLGGNVFFVQDAIAVTEASYSAFRGGAGQMDLRVPIREVLLPRVGISAQFEHEHSLTIREPRYVAFKAMQITDFVDTGLTSAGRATVHLKPLEEAEIAAKLDGT